MCTSMRACKGACVYGNVSVRASERASGSTCACMNKREPTHVQACERMFTWACMRITSAACLSSFRFACVRACMHVRARACVCKCACVWAGFHPTIRPSMRACVFADCVACVHDRVVPLVCSCLGLVPLGYTSTPAAFFCVYTCVQCVPARVGSTSACTDTQRTETGTTDHGVCQVNSRLRLPSEFSLTDTAATQGQLGPAPPVRAIARPRPARWCQHGSVALA